MQVSARFKWTIVAIVSQSVLLFLAERAQSQVTGDLDVLPVVAEAWRANLAKIETWRGRVRMTSYQVEHGETTERNIASIDFFLKVRSGLLCSLITYEVADGKEINEKEVLNCLIDDGRLTYLRSYRKTNGEIGSDIQIMPFTGQLSSSSPPRGFNPMSYFGDHGRSVADRFMFYFKNAKEPNVNNWVVTRDNNIVELSHTKDDRLEKYTVDLDQGGNLTRVALTNDAADTVFEWTYEQREGTWVPSFYKYQTRKPPQQNSWVNFGCGS